MLRSSGWMVLLLASCMVPVSGISQQVTVTTPLVGVNDSFYEHFNLGWGFQRNWGGGSWFVNFGGPMVALPQFGGFNPANGLFFGLGTVGNGFQINGTASTGSDRTMTMSAPSVTMMNGARGNIFSGEIRPFVTGLIPVVGDGGIVPYASYPQFGYAPAPLVVSPLSQRLERLRNEPLANRTKNASGRAHDSLELDGGASEVTPVVASSRSSSAERGDISVAEIRRLQALEDEAKQKELKALIAGAREAERAGQLALARIRYKQAAARADGELRRELLEAFDKLSTVRTEPKR